MESFGDDSQDGGGYEMPPPIYPNYGGAGGSPFNANQPGQGTQDEERDGDPKRRRIARACDMCRKKKIKCDGKMPKCSHCINYKTECIFTQVEKKRNPPKGAKYIEGLENRMRRLEGLLKMAGIADNESDIPSIERRLQQAQQQSQHGDLNTFSAAVAAARSSLENPQKSSTGSLHSTPRDSNSSSRVAESPTSQEDKEHEVEALSDMMCSLVTTNCGETRYIGSSSGFSIFSPRGIQWVNEKTGDTSFHDMIQAAYIDDNKWLYWKPEIFSDIFARRVFKPLPPKEEAMSLFRDFFDNFNAILPLFHEPTFMHLVERQYSRDPYEGSGWWASINIVLAIAHRLRVMSHLVPQEEDKKAWLYLKNAMGVLTELTMRNTDLLSVQALLGMSLFLQGTPNPQPSFFLVAAAIRLSHSIGLHKRGSLFNLNPVEVEQRKRVFWIAYLLDKDICLRSGRPPVQDDDDMNVELPSEIPPDNAGLIPLIGEGTVNMFRLMCRFAIIESRVYKRLYSTKAAKQSDGELLNTIGELDRELEEWKDSIPVDYRPEHEIKATHPPLILHVMILHFAYYNCLTTIHRMAVHHGYWTSRLSNYAIQGLYARPLNPRVFSSANICVTAARASINLIKYIPQGDFACVWLVLYYPVSALVTLFANILQNPQDARVRSDIKLMNIVVNFLSMLGTDESNGSVRRMLSVCAEFERIAKVVLDKAEKEALSKRKRKASTEDVDTNNTQRVDTSNRPAATAADAENHIDTTASSLREQQQQQATPPGTQPTTQPPIGVVSPNPSDMMSGTFGDISSANMPMFNPEVSFADAPNLQTTTVPTMASPSDTQFYPFQQSFVPQDLWQMPMGLEWDWADFSNVNLLNMDQPDMFQATMHNGM
ncbi:fungal specific transcription factor, putative [Talaromyces stipitatus ATCC 10500]|uniref:Fungal specific transcription factor, putative n=1 Tax=Talaromyces stipitatus (strain ATCC 10500 / CBS 375.48 / QM 6759 / NRRL 1006) TaxID=441959 RepID=B8M6S2_TALSN|nr:fungal specific transcription factor, putative [Talaromyces stipitatus ATCC 10500]EED20142.1 fungal specific transcription factor, putative [Talaromyces stipitatus ATCC 10500]